METGLGFHVRDQGILSSWGDAVDGGGWEGDVVLDPRCQFRGDLCGKAKNSTGGQRTVVCNVIAAHDRNSASFSSLTCSQTLDQLASRGLQL